MVEIALAPVAWWLAQCAHASPLEWLACSERQRLDHIAHAGRRAQFIAGRFALRALLAAHCPQTQWQDWGLMAPVNAPPSILTCSDVVRSHVGTLHLSLAHSADLLAVALADQPIGIDLEVPRKPRALDGLMNIACTTEERARILQLPQAAQQRAFDAIWTLKEAWFKREATGIDLSKISRLQTHQSLATTTARNSWLAQGEAYTLAICTSTQQDHALRWRILEGSGAPDTVPCHVELLSAD